MRSTRVASATLPAAFLGWLLLAEIRPLAEASCGPTGVTTPPTSLTIPAHVCVKRESASDSPGIQTRVKSSKHCQLPSPEQHCAGMCEGDPEEQENKACLGKRLFLRIETHLNLSWVEGCLLRCETRWCIRLDRDRCTDVGTLFPGTTMVK